MLDGLPVLQSKPTTAVHLSQFPALLQALLDHSRAPLCCLLQRCASHASCSSKGLLLLGRAHRLHGATPEQRIVTIKAVFAKDRYVPQIDMFIGEVVQALLLHCAEFGSSLKCRCFLPDRVRVLLLSVNATAVTIIHSTN